MKNNGEGKNLRVAIAGNPNSGKTSIDYLDFKMKTVMK